MSHRQRMERSRRYRRRVALLSTLLPLTATVDSQPASAADGVRRLPQVERHEPSSPAEGKTFVSPAQQIPSEWSKAVPLLPLDHAGELPGTLPNAGSPHQAKEPKPIELAARRLAALQATPDPPVTDTSWLASITSNSCNQRASVQFDQAYREYTFKAYASAESSAWKTLELLATGIDVSAPRVAASGRRTSTAHDVTAARTAIAEAQDFVDQGAAVMERDRLVAIATSHRTPVFHSGIHQQVTPTEAVDRYLDYARQRLTPLAGYHVQAAQTMDLIAAIRLGRGDAKLLPEEVSLCLRRAALAGQPDNADLAARLGAQLADMGLSRESGVMLRHVESLRPSTRPSETAGRLELEEAGEPPAKSLQPVAGTTRVSRVPDVIQLTPKQFASISPRDYVGSPRPSADDVSQRPRTRPGVPSERDARSIEGTAFAESMTTPANNIGSKAPSSSKPSVFAKLAGFRRPKTRRSVPMGSPTNATDARSAQSSGSATSFAHERPAAQAPHAVFDDTNPANSYESVPHKRPSMWRRAIAKLPWTK